MLQQIKKKSRRLNERTVLGDDHFILGRRGRVGAAGQFFFLGGGGVRLFFCMTSTGQFFKVKRKPE